MTKSGIKLVLCLLVAGGAALLIFLQSQTQQKLRAENESLRQQIDQLKSPNQDAPATTSNPASHEDFNELLRLRGEVSALRVQTNQIARLQQQNQQLQNSLTNAVQARQQSAAQSAAEAEDERARNIRQINVSRQVVLALIVYANYNQNQFPTNFNQAAAYLGNSPEVATNLNNFEIVYRGSFADVANPSEAILVRSSQPWMVNGKWTKVYGFVDGHSVTHSEPDGNFDQYEQQHGAVLKNQ